MHVYNADMVRTSLFHDLWMREKTSRFPKTKRKCDKTQTFVLRNSLVTITKSFVSVQMRSIVDVCSFISRFCYYERRLNMEIDNHAIQIHLSTNKRKCVEKIMDCIQHECVKNDRDSVVLKTVFIESTFTTSEHLLIFLRSFFNEKNKYHIESGKNCIYLHISTDMPIRH